MLEEQAVQHEQHVAITVLPVISSSVPTKLAIASKVTGKAAYSTRTGGISLFQADVAPGVEHDPVPISVKPSKGGNQEDDPP